jgi:transcriptional regulator with XRE-family HTH domain
LTVRFDDIGNRLKAFRLASGLSADEIARRLGISRAAVYRFERGELVKIETLDKLSELLGVSVPTLLGVGVEYLPSAVAYFERLRQIEETASHIIVLAGPISYLLASPAFHQRLAGVLSESIPEGAQDRRRALADIAQIMRILAQRKDIYARRRPTIVNLLAASEVDRLLQNGLTGRFDLPERQRRERRAHARAEVEHLLRLTEDHPIDVQIGIVPDTLPHTGFQIFRQPDREVLSISPFRLGEHPNVRVGVAMVTSAPEALSLHHRAAAEMWRRAHKGAAAARQLKALLRLYKK